MGKVDDIRLKVKHAWVLFESFTAAIAADRPANSSEAVAVSYQLERQRIAVTAKQPERDAILHWGIQLGDVVHQLRAALDHLIYALATRTLKLPDKEIKKLSFPILKDENQFNRLHPRHGLLERTVGSDEYAEVERAQPYRRSADVLADPMWILRILDNIDKHRTVLLLDLRVLILATAIAEDRGYDQPVVIDAAVKEETIEYILSRPDPATSVRVNGLSYFLMLAETEGLCDRVSILPLVRDMLHTVDETLGRFARFFPDNDSVAR